MISMRLVWPLSSVSALASNMHPATNNHLHTANNNDMTATSRTMTTTTTITDATTGLFVLFSFPPFFFCFLVLLYYTDKSTETPDDGHMRPSLTQLPM